MYENRGYYESHELSTQVTPTPRRRRKEKSFLSRKAAAWVLALTIVCSGAAGYGGSYLAAQGGSAPAAGTSGLNVTQTALTTGQSSSSASLGVEDVAALAADTVVEITTESVSTSYRMGQYVQEGAGSGVILSEDGYIVTNNHVIEGAGKITVRLRNGETYDATLIGTDAGSDVAVIKIDAAGLQAAVLGDSDQLAVGQTVVAIGNPLGELGGTVTDGIVSALDREIDIDGVTMNLLQTNAAINPGNSGGGLFNSKGELIGLVNAKAADTGVEGLGFAIPINDVQEVVTQLMQNGYVSGRPEVGITLVDVSNVQTAMQYGVRSTGVYIQSVKAGSGAEKAGLQAGDLILGINGTEIASSADVSSVISDSSVGDQITFTIMRGNQSGTVTVTVGEKTA